MPVDPPSNYAANVAAKVTSSGIMAFVRNHTTKGRIDKGYQRMSTAIATLKEHQDVVKPSDLAELAQRLALCANVSRKKLPSFIHLFVGYWRKGES
jgi:hypothetical protein